MAMTAGDADTNGTMAKAIYDSMVGEMGAPSSEAEQAWKDVARAVALGVINHMAAYADVRITASDGGLQTGADVGNPTTAPASDQVLSGALE